MATTFTSTMPRTCLQKRSRPPFSPRSSASNGSRVCPFGFHMFGDKVGRLTLKTIQDQGTLVLKSLEGSQGLRWKNIQVELSVTPDHWLSFTAEGVAGHTNVVAIDDISLYTGPCLDNSTVPDFRCNDGLTIPQEQVCDYRPQCVGKEDERWCANCDFMEDTCGWKSVETSDDQTRLWWQRIYTNITGPDDPHSYHMGVLKKSGSVVNKPRLLTRVLQPTHHTCALHFDYELYADDYPGPEINIYIEHGGADLTKVYHAQGFFSEWQTLALPLGRISSSYHLLIEAAASIDLLQAVSIDEFLLSNCWPPTPCEEVPEGYTVCENKACVPPDALCDFTDDCGDYTDEASCDNYPARCAFEDGSTCDWSATDMFNLTEARQSTSAPFRDHTLNTAAGHYIQMLKSVVTGALYSPIIQPSSGCQRFYHALGGSTSTSLHIRAQSAASNEILTEETLEAYTSETFYWQRFHADFTIFETFYLALVGDIPESGSIGLDDISLSPECQVSQATPTPPVLTTTDSSACGSDQYKCKSTGVCISRDQVCDFNLDCDQGDDEELCGTTTFENNTGGWQDVSETSYSWSRVYSPNAQYPNNTAPITDHTGDGEGYYMWVPARLADIPEAMAIMKSPPAGPPAMPCSVTLWYYCKDTIPSLSLSAWTAGTFNEMINSKDLSCSGNQGWRQAQLYIGEQNYRISAEVASIKWASEWSSTMYDAAVDDVSFSRCSRNQEASSEDIRCTFSEPCDLYQCKNDGMDWSTDVENHNTYAFVAGNTQYSRAILQTYWRKPSVGFCFSFR
ncbi:MAM and LDL-receptor class A domain-containing protein 2-like [Penaeus monodon]|uniref:MAM and LDL-receptor class A domain-containing protein 2-like n=1 Tax=Penaeus monodon TaxID=6687 RepID=UPI0018A7336B|nr:MAM and LDL-receptor class A domain-containing protein 2-like [Penaeus monodon]